MVAVAAPGPSWAARRGLASAGVPPGQAFGEQERRWAEPQAPRSEVIWGSGWAEEPWGRRFEPRERLWVRRGRPWGALPARVSAAPHERKLAMVSGRESAVRRGPALATVSGRVSGTVLAIALVLVLATVWATVLVTESVTVWVAASATSLVMASAKASAVERGLGLGKGSVRGSWGRP